MNISLIIIGKTQSTLVYKYKSRSNMRAHSILVETIRAHRGLENSITIALGRLKAYAITCSWNLMISLYNKAMDADV